MTVEELYSLEQVRNALRTMGFHGHMDAVVMHKFIHFLIQVGRADALWALTEQWAKEGKQNASHATYLLHHDARTEARRRSSEIREMAGVEFGDDAGKAWN